MRLRHRILVALTCTHPVEQVRVTRPAWHGPSRPPVDAFAIQRTKLFRPQCMLPHRCGRGARTPLLACTEKLLLCVFFLCGQSSRGFRKFIIPHLIASITTSVRRVVRTATSMHCISVYGCDEREDVYKFDESI